MVDELTISPTDVKLPGVEILEKYLTSKHLQASLMWPKRVLGVLTKVFTYLNVYFNVFKQGKNVCKPTTFRCYQCFNLRLLLFLASRVNWLKKKKFKLRSFVTCFSLPTESSKNE